MRRRFSLPIAACLATLLCWSAAAPAQANETEVQPPVIERFAPADVSEEPDFQRHVVPLFGRLGCNGRACHGSFQGRGGFRLSLFGYDFKADHAALLDEDNPRVDRDDPAYSLILMKPTNADEHEGGLRYEKDGWEYRLLRNWIDAGARYDRDEPEKLVRLEVEPAELWFSGKDQKAQLKAIAVWDNGDREDVTPLCRFQSNDEQISVITSDGLVTSGEAGDTHVVVSYDNAVVPVPVIRPVSELVGDKYPKVDTPTKVDELVEQKLRKLGVVPSDLADDAEFLRRLRLDLTASLPTPQEVEAFLADKSPDKRAKKINELLETPAYAAWWTTQLCDYTGNNADQLINTSPVRGSEGQHWYDWIYKRVAENTPYDELAAGIVTAQSRREGQSYLEFCEEMSALYHDGSGASFADFPSMPYYWARRDLRQPPERAISFAYAFMGVRIQCAQCHKHPFDQWSKEDFEEFTQFFGNVIAANQPQGEARKDYNEMIKDLGLEGKRGNEVRRELASLLRDGKTVPFPEVYARPVRANNNNRNRRSNGNEPSGVEAKLLGSDAIDLTQYDDARQPLMDWLRSKDNPYFAKAFVNRVWASYFGVGIVNPPDDMSLANPPSNKPLLDYLAAGFIESGFDMKWVHREILNSSAYQRSWKPNDTNGGDERNFSRAIPRRLPAEVAYDAVLQATASDEELARLHREIEDRAIGVASSGNRYNRNRDAAYALTVFGRSTRETNCDCDRSSEASLLQTVFLRNDGDMLGLIDRQLSNRRADPGWLDQIAATVQPQQQKQQRPAGDAEASARVKQRFAALRKQLEQAKKKENVEQVKRLQQQLAQLRERADELRADHDKEQEPVKAAAPLQEIDTVELVRQAYLRTLSRYPTEEELQASRQYVEADEDLVNGARGLLWALLNTKEFIVNH